VTPEATGSSTDHGPGPGDLAAVREAGEDRFGELVEPHRRELRVHCYRLLGSFEQAEDLVQETYLRAWRHRATFQGRSTLRAWLYKIATNACLEELRRRPRPAPIGSVTDGRLPPPSALPWVQPFPDALLDLPGPAEEQPDALVMARETIALAYLIAIQLLPPQQRAVLVLREVLRFSAKETGELLGITVAAANSALQRARTTLSSYQRSLDPGAPAPTTQPSRDERKLVDTYMRAHEKADPDAIIAMLRADARLSISPTGLCWDGRDEITPSFLEGMGALGTWRCLSTRANGQPAVANYLRAWGEADHRAFTVVVLGMRDGELTDMATFAEPQLFPAFGLPLTLA
jgi:RNA polymerase sigma-70 factor, ECF subfamily